MNVSKNENGKKDKNIALFKKKTYFSVRVRDNNLLSYYKKNTFKTHIKNRSK
jgi:hypothetical protein